MGARMDGGEGVRGGVGEEGGLGVRPSLEAILQGPWLMPEDQATPRLTRVTLGEGGDLCRDSAKEQGTGSPTYHHLSAAPCTLIHTASLQYCCEP